MSYKHIINELKKDAKKMSRKIQHDRRCFPCNLCTKKKNCTREGVRGAPCMSLTRKKGYRWES